MVLAKYVLVAVDGKYSIRDEQGKPVSRWPTRAELNNAILRSQTAVDVAEAVGRQAEPLLKMISEQKIARTAT